MKKDRLDLYDELPSGMKKYLSAYGWHFSKPMCDWAVGMMKDRQGNKLQPYDKEKVEALLKQHGVEVGTDMGYDAVYLMNMARADYYGSSIVTEQQLAKFVGDYINDKDGYDGIAFTRFFADMSASGKPIIWEDVF